MVEEEAKAKAKAKVGAEDTMIVVNNKILKTTMFMILKGEEKVKVVTIPPLTKKNQKINLILSALSAIDLATIKLV